MIFNGNVVYLQYGKHNDIYFDWSMVRHFVNFYSQMDMYFGRTFLSMDVSTILSCARHASEGNVKFPFFGNWYDIEEEETHAYIDEIKSLIQSAKQDYIDNSAANPKIVLIPYHQKYENCIIRNGSHVVILVVDLSLYDNANSIMVFDSSHFLLDPINGIKITESFGSLKDQINQFPLNETKFQPIYKTTCTFWAEAFICLISQLIEQNINNPNFGLNEVKEFLESHKSQLEIEHYSIIESVGSWFVKYCNCCVLFD